LWLLAQQKLSVQALEPPDPRWVEFQVTTGTLKSGSVSIYDDTILWSQYAGWFSDGGCNSFVPYPYHPEDNPQQMLIIPPEEPWNICLYDSHSQTITTAHEGGHLYRPQRYGDWIVMDRNTYVSQVAAKNLHTGEVRYLWGDSGVPRIYGDIVVATPFTGTLMAHNLDTGIYTTIVQVPNYPNWGIPGDIYKNTIVWTQAQLDPIDFNIMGYDLITQQTFTISAQPGDEFGARIDQDIVVWSWNDDIYGYDLQSDQRLTITQDAATQNSPKISGNLVIWKDDRNAAWDIYAYNLKTGEEYRVTQQPDNIRGIDIWGNLIVWERAEVGLFGSTADEIRAARLMSHFHFLPFIQQTASTP
jgi:beta propeller repeat protein